MLSLLLIAACSRPPPGPTVVMVVMDTVRADHLSACGYERPTSPTLERLVRQGAQLRCDAVAPGSWTLPSHASFFTGKPFAEHGAHFVASGTELLGLMQVAPLDAAHETLAEHFVAQGFETISVSGNPLIADVSGLTQGFGTAIAPADFGQLSDAAWVDALKGALDSRDSSRPLFLFLNLSEAHQPWDDIPGDVGWAPERAGGRPDMEGVLSGRVSGRHLDAHVAQIGDLYDYGVWRADRSLGAALELLDERGLDRELRLVLTADHGEYLGEHGLVDHGRSLWEPNQRVPLLTMGVDPELPETVSAMAAHALVLDRPVPVGAVTAAAWPDHFWARMSSNRQGRAMWAAVWEGDRKWTWVNGAVQEYALSADPGELNGAPAEPDIDWGAITGRPQLRSVGDPALQRKLKSLGYSD